MSSDFCFKTVRAELNKLLDSIEPHLPSDRDLTILKTFRDDGLISTLEDTVALLIDDYGRFSTMLEKPDFERIEAVAAALENLLGPYRIIRDLCERHQVKQD